MSARVAVVGTVLVVLAAVLQLCAVARLPLPGSPPDLPLVVVLAVALALGPVAGMLTGFASGALADLQADHALGRLALAYVVVACAVGLRAGDDRSVLLPWLAVAGGAAGALALFAVEGLLLDDPRVSATALGAGLVSAVPYAAVLMPLVVPVVRRLLVGRPAVTR